MIKVNTRVTHVDLSQRTQTSIGEKVQPAVAAAQWLMLIVASLGAFILLSVGFVAFPPPPYLAGFFSISAFAVIVFVGSLAFGVILGAREGGLRFSVSSGLTWVSQAPLLGRLTILGLALVATALGVYSVVCIVVGIAQNGGNVWGAAPRSAWVLGVVFLGLSAFAWRETYRAFRANIGVRLAPDRVGLNHGHKDLFLYWKQIANVTVETVNKGTERKKRMVSCVRIDVEDGRVFHVDIVELGSDPNVVAALMRYYLDRPQERHVLANPEEAIRRFSEAQSLT